MKVYDTFADEIIDEEEMEVIAPPERYIVIDDRDIKDRGDKNDESKER